MSDSSPLPEPSPAPANRSEQQQLRLKALGQRIQVTGISCNGKSTLAARPAELKGCPVVELDALNWLPNWVGLNETDPERFRARIREAVAGERWVVAGSYKAFSKDLIWPQLDTLIWLDLPRWRLLLRVLRRSWKRSRSKELLWGTNRESFWPQLAVWRREDSLIWWIWNTHGPNRKAMLDVMTDPAWQHLRILRLTSAREVEELFGP